MLSTLSIIVSLLAILSGYVLLVVRQNSHSDSFEPLSLPGPVVLGAIDGVNLDGLTLIRTVRLPAIILKLPGIGVLKIKNQSSELVFKKLRVTDVRIKASDAASAVISTTAKAALDFSGTCLAQVEFTLDLSWIGLSPYRFKTQSSGRLSVALSDLSADLGVQIGRNKQTGVPAIRHRPILLAQGHFERISFSTSPLARHAARLPLWLSMAPVTNFLLADFLRSQEVASILTDLATKISPFLDARVWESISVERQLAPPKPAAFPDKLEAKFSIVGKTNFTQIALPDHHPDLYPEGGKRAYIQSWNKFTSGVKLDITKNMFETLSFHKVAIEWLDVPPEDVVHEIVDGDTFDGFAVSGHTYKMICRIEGLFTEVTSAFAFYADMGKVLQLVTNQRQIGEKGESRAQARAGLLELVFQVHVDETGIKVKTLRIDDLDHIEVTITGLRSRANDLVNSALKIVKPQIATVAGMLIRRFLEEKVKHATTAFETVEEALLLRGVEVPGLFRSTSQHTTESLKDIPPIIDTIT